MAQSQTFTAVGSNGVLMAQPSVVQFAGFELQRRERRRLSLVNVGPRPTRFHVLGPTTAFFRLAVSEGMGTIRPGMSQVVEVEFQGQACQYYYDTM